MSAYADSSEDAQNISAFRAAEKKYQLHMEQQMRYRGGRLRGGKLVAQPTDLSDVIDIRATAAAATNAVYQVHQLQLKAGSSLQSSVGQIGCCTSCSRSSGSLPDIQQNCTAANGQPACAEQRQQVAYQPVTALTFPAHPGLAVFPEALSSALQLQLMRAALEQWPEPPTRTNHTKVYGFQLAGLFTAAQAGLVLAQQPSQQPVEQQQQQEQQAGITAHVPAAQAAASAQHGDAAAAAAIAAVRKLSCHCSDASCPAATAHHRHQQQQQQDGAGVPSAQESTAHPPSAAQLVQVGSCCCCCSSRRAPASSLWASSGQGPRACILLRKLRWASLGPPFNWTDRVYEHHVEHTPLPAELASIACQYAALAGKITNAGASSRATLIDRAADSSTDSSAAELASQQQQELAQGAQFKPDVALVNYYHAGDTLGGHKDDVEPDMTQPIVTLSLGCEAVFLMGGTSRDQQPTALLLRSGDVVVLGGPARSCYHGVPRIFTHKDLKQELVVAAKQQPAFEPYLEYFKQCRVNISVRSGV